MSFSRQPLLVLATAAVGVAMPLIGSTAPGPTVIFVDDDNCPGPGTGTELDPYCSIQTAIENAVDTDEIIVAPGTYFETINFLGKAITLRSLNGPEVTVIDAQLTGSVVTCHSLEGTDTVLDGFTITGGSASHGGGMFNIGSNPTVTNCTFSGNIADFSGGGMANFLFSSPAVTNCTFSGNSSGVSGGGMHNSNSSPTVTNCILWNDSPNEISADTITVTYSTVEGGFAGVGNIDADPMFVDPINGDYRLASGSPGIDAGNNWGVPIDVDDYDQDGNTAELFPVDLDGNPRFNADEADFDPGCGVPVVVDMGAYEYQFDPVEDVIFADLNGDGVVGILDLLGVLAAWGDADNNCLADLDIDGEVGIFDLLTLLGSWG